jgi:hypothetical protein
MAKKKSNIDAVLLRGYWLSSLIAVLAIASMEASAASKQPRLVVNITIDQLRSDYLDAFMPLYGNDGFKRLFSEGRVYTRAEYPFATIDRASSIAALTTGTVPYDNGIVGQQWVNRNTLRPINCVADATVRGLQTDESLSPAKLMVSTLGDELKIATDGKALVYSIAPYSDAAILSAGHAADGAFWINDKTGDWCGSSYYSASLPSWVQMCNSYQGLRSRIESVTWQPYNDLVGNFSYFPSKGVTKPFKHTFKTTRKYTSYKYSGCVNEEVTRAVMQCLSSTPMGVDGVTDMLNVTYYAGSFDNQPVDAYPVELQDTYVRLDNEIGKLLSTVERKVGRENVLVVVTSTGYVREDVSENISKFRVPTGDFNITQSASLLNIYLSALYGNGRYVETVYGSEIYLNQKLMEEKKINVADLLERSQDLLQRMSGVKDVYTSERLTLGAWTPGISKIRNSYNPKCSGDIRIMVSPGWRLVNGDTHESKQIRESFVGFPLFFWGNEVKAEQIDTPVTVDCIAPTVSQSIRIRAPNACSSVPLTGVW